MNSKLLEEAIIDAESLRESALKNAEQAILEKYAPEVKTAIESLLEQEVAPEQDAMTDMVPQEETSMDIPLAATNGENLCPCPDDDENVIISIQDLKKAISDIARGNKDAEQDMAMEPAPEMNMEPAPEMGMPPQDEMPPEETPEESPLMEEIEIDDSLLESLLSEQEGLSAQQKQFLQNHPDKRGALLYWKSFPDSSVEKMEAIKILTDLLGPEEVEATLKKDEESNQRMIKDLGDKLKSGKTDSTDVRPSADSHKFGKRGSDYVRPTGLEESEGENEKESDEDKKLSPKQSKELDADGDGKLTKSDFEKLGNKKKTNENKKLSEENSKLLVEQKKAAKQNKLLTEKLNKLLEQHKEILEENKKVKKAALQISKRLDETNLMNAKLLYKNQALGSDSLNERQKDKIVEAVSKAGSVDEAKMIYETLCNAVGSFDSKGPQSLSEAVETKSSIVIKSRQQQNASESNPLYNKWQKIAGIKK